MHYIVDSFHRFKRGICMYICSSRAKGVVSYCCCCIISTGCIIRVRRACARHLQTDTIHCVPQMGCSRRGVVSYLSPSIILSCVGKDHVVTILICAGQGIREHCVPQMGCLRRGLSLPSIILIMCGKGSCGHHSHLRITCAIISANHPL